MNNYTVKASPISGKGVFSTRPILENESIGLSFVHQNNTGDPDRDYTRTELGQFANHSDTPNMQLAVTGKNIYFIATKNIESGEELTVNYHAFPWEGKREF